MALGGQQPPMLRGQAHPQEMAQAIISQRHSRSRDNPFSKSTTPPTLVWLSRGCAPLLRLYTPKLWEKVPVPVCSW